LAEDLVILFPFKHRIPKEKVVEDDASGEDIADCVTFRVHVFDVDDLWCNKAGSSAPHEQVFLFICVSGESEIADGEIKAVFLPEHDVLGFEISVYDSQFGQVAECSEDVLDDLLDFSGLYFFVALEQFIKLLAL
jgi:hypothetical protein